jgi:uncharacterized Zn-finger protein
MRRQRAVQCLADPLCCGAFRFSGGKNMTTHDTPHFHNQAGVPQVRVGVKEFMCVGALPPFDHPHIFIDMGGSDDAICPYCSTHYVYDPALGGGCDPAASVFESPARAAPAAAHV